MWHTLLYKTPPSKISSISCTFAVCFLSLYFFLCSLLLSTGSYTISTMHHSHQYPLPCLYCHPYSYIRMVIYLPDSPLKSIIWVLSWFEYNNLYINPHACKIMQVQNLIERCMLFHMSQDQCIKALAEHAGIKPLVTVTGPNLLITLSFFFKYLTKSICCTWGFFCNITVWTY